MKKANSNAHQSHQPQGGMELMHAFKFNIFDEVLNCARPL